MTNIIGIDYSGANEEDGCNTWVVQGSMTPDGVLKFTDARGTLRKDVYNLLASVSTPAVAAIDFPFGVPIEFAEFLNKAAIESMPEMWRVVASLSFQDFSSARDSFLENKGFEPKRAGDKAHYPGSFSPLHKVNPNMLPMTYHGIKMLHELHKKYADRWITPPLHSEKNVSDQTVTLLETMPGAFLKAIGTINKGYKNPKDTQLKLIHRNCILKALASSPNIELPNLQDLREICLANHNCLDAVVATVIAASWVTAPTRFLRPSADEMAKARLEGWIYASQTS